MRILSAPICLFFLSYHTRLFLARFLCYNGAKGCELMQYSIIRSSRKTVSLQITPEGKVLVRCPNRMAKREIDRFVQSKADWIEAHLQKIAERPAMPRLTETELKALAGQARELLPRLVREFAPRVGVTYGRITIRCQRTRWGSCSAPGNLNFNCLLMLSPPEVQSYVVVHELCHRKEMNHSPRFWQEVERVMPDYRTHKKWLKDNGNALMARLPE